MFDIVAIMGVVAYNKHKLKKEVTHDITNDVEELEDKAGPSVSEDEREKLIDR